ncbi:MAG: hypothetical protein ABMA02_16915, partial [Saprospiraceae bacterium]
LSRGLEGFWGDHPPETNVRVAGGLPLEKSFLCPPKSNPIMIQRTLLLAALIACPVFGLNAQTLEETLNKLASTLGDISDEKTTYRQQVTFEADKPFRLTYRLISVSKKDGKENEERYEVNLADLDKHLLRRETSSKMLAIEIKTRNNLSAIKYYENGEQENYQNKLPIRAKDSENMDAIEQLLREAIPLAEARWEKSVQLDLNDLPALVNWLKQAVKTVTVDDVRYVQTLTTDGRDDRLLLDIKTETKNGSKTQQFRFSLADLMEQRVLYKISGDKVVLNADTRRDLKLVHVRENEEQKNYDNSISLFCNDPDDAKRIMLVLRKAIPLAEASVAKQIKMPKSAPEALGLIKTNVVAVPTSKREIAQTFGGDCTASLRVSIAENEKNQQYDYIFDLGDLDERETELSVKGQEIFIALQTAHKNKYIRVHKNGELQSYTDDVVIAVPDIETARQLEPQLAYAIKECRQKIAPKDIEWLSAQLLNIKDAHPFVTQKLERQQAGNDCKFSLGVSTSGKKEVVELYEFTLKDIDSSKIEIKVSGKTVEVEMPTARKEKLVNYYKDTKPSYVDKVVFLAAGIPEAKAMAETLKTIVERCK